jgi:hypothetical protein
MVCKQCGCAYARQERKNSSGYCSKQCRHKGLYQKRERHSAKCEACGSAFWARSNQRKCTDREECGRRCQDNRTLPTIACARCGKQITRPQKHQRCCSFKCRRQYRYANPRRNECACGWCGERYVPKAADRTTYCGRECSGAARLYHLSWRSLEGTLWMVRPTIAIVVRPVDEPVDVARWRWRRDDRRRRGCVPQRKQCGYCDGWFVTTNLMDALYCSARCATKVARQKRRLQLRAAYREPIWLPSLIERDAGCCKICGWRVEVSRCVPHPLAPTIDHVIPISKGGLHTQANVQLAHFICNSRKGDKILSA